MAAAARSPSARRAAAATASSQISMASSAGSGSGSWPWMARSQTTRSSARDPQQPGSSYSAARSPARTQRSPSHSQADLGDAPLLGVVGHARGAEAHGPAGFVVADPRHVRDLAVREEADDLEPCAGPGQHARVDDPVVALLARVGDDRRRRLAVHAERRPHDHGPPIGVQPCEHVEPVRGLDERRRGVAGAVRKGDLGDPERLACPELQRDDRGLALGAQGPGSRRRLLSRSSITHLRLRALERRPWSHSQENSPGQRESGTRAG